MFDPYAIIDTILLTEKSLAKQTENKYVFKIAKKATKIDVARAVEAIYNVKVKDVNVLNRQGKLKRINRRGAKPGFTAATKRAIVTLSEGKIEII